MQTIKHAWFSSAVANDDTMRWMMKTTKQPHHSAIVQTRRFSLFGYIAWMPDKPDAKKTLIAPPRRTVGRPPLRGWRLSISSKDLKSNNLSPNEATDMAQNRPLWRLSTFGATHY